VFNKEDMVEPQLAQTVCTRYNAVSISAIQRETLRRLILRVQAEILRLHPVGERSPWQELHVIPEEQAAVSV
jgi:hypothetical protein